MEVNLNAQDLKDAERVIKSDKFAKFLMSNTTSFGAAAFILQTLLDAVDNAKKALEIKE